MELEEFENLISEDNRTYVAIRTLPNNRGVFGYVAITMGDGDETQWLDCKGNPIQTPTPSHLPVEHVKGLFQILEPKRSDVKEVWLVLKNRKPVCSRNDSYDMYKTLYHNVEQEMLIEGIKNKCNHPFINKLLECLKVIAYMLICIFKKNMLIYHIAPIINNNRSNVLLNNFFYRWT